MEREVGLDEADAQVEREAHPHQSELQFSGVSSLSSSGFAD